MSEIQEMIKTLSEAGYLVFHVPYCKIDRPHGRHTLITRSAHCEGSGPIPHGYHSGNMGTLGE